VKSLAVGDVNSDGLPDIAMAAFPSATLRILRQTSEPPLRHYTVQTQTGQSVIPGTSDLGLHCDDCGTRIQLPFPFTLYNHTYSSAWVNVNGYLEFQYNEDEDLPSCIPTPRLGSAIAPFWWDLNTSYAGDGVFTAITGTAPHRQFIVEWRAYNVTSGFTDFEVVLTEDSGVVSMIYDTTDGGQHSTIGLQAHSTFGDQFECGNPQLSDGLRVDYIPAPQPPPPTPPTPPPPPIAPPPPPVPPAPGSQSTCRVPSVVGRHLRLAKNAIRRRHCRTGRVRYRRSRRARGIVVSQSPRAGLVRPIGTRVNLGVSRGRR
jgi:hypothetical protein